MPILGLSFSLEVVLECDRTIFTLVHAFLHTPFTENHSLVRKTEEESIKGDNYGSSSSRRR